MTGFILLLYKFNCWALPDSLDNSKYQNLPVTLLLNSDNEALICFLYCILQNNNGYSAQIKHHLEIITVLI